MATPKTSLNKEDELAVILGKLENLFRNQTGKGLNIPPLPYNSIKGQLSLISEHQQKFKLKKIEDLSIPDLDYLLRTISSLKIKNDALKEKIDHLLDKKFQKLCSSCLLIKLEHKNPYLFSYCNVEILFHYVSAKEKLNMLRQLKGDKKLAFILGKTYDLEKTGWFKEKYLRLNHNQWVHLVAAINNLEILNAEEKKAILKHNAELKIDKKQPVLAQLWNRIWLFKELGIRNIEELRSIFPSQREFLEAKKNICDFPPKILNFEKEDIFAEGINIMRGKYISIRNFCHVK